jgi:4'-phosphopantetheinyl transferase
MDVRRRQVSGMWWLSCGESDLPAEGHWLSAAESERRRTMRFTKRRSEWLLARWTGKNAIAAVLGFPRDLASLARIEIRSVLEGPSQGAPEVFVGGDRISCRVSLTDRAGWAVCAVSEEAEVGCDLELVEPRSENMVRDFFTPSEQQVVAKPPFEAPPDLTANLIWSAKESALKVLRTGLRRDTRSVEVVLTPDEPVQGWRGLVTRTEEGVRFSGWWRQYGAFILTVVAAVDLPPPRAIREPPKLASAEPSHSWMTSPLVPED